MRKTIISMLALGLLCATASAHSIQYDLDEELHQGAAAWASYESAREQYGYPPYATEHLVTK